ncbi:Gti1/Pac2 family-domain-containing protein, partial [Phlyctochytrium arcticum]
METWHGFVETLEDAVLLLEACRQGYLRRNQRRLTETEKKRIESGSVYLWDEEEAQIRRWTDCRSWSPSRRRLERFLVCHEIDGHVKPKYRNSEETRSNNDDSDGCTYKRKVGGLCKRCLSVITTDGRRQHLVAYYLEEDVRQGKLSRPFDDSYLSSISV